jgi:hypothetical protein
MGCCIHEMPKVSIISPPFFKQFVLGWGLALVGSGKMNEEIDG